MKEGKQIGIKKFLWVAVIFLGLILFNTVLFRFLLSRNESIFFILAASIVLSWIMILTLYYIWAIYFYNVNLGWTDHDWAEHTRRVKANLPSTPPTQNPHQKETLGLPPGTVRGTIALSVLVGGLGMLIASLAIPGTYSHNDLIVDHFEYIKTAFLMVIAFYFGSKSLEYIDRKKIFSSPAATEVSDTKKVTPQHVPANTGTPAMTTITLPTTHNMPLPETSTLSETADTPDFNDPNAKG